VSRDALLTIDVEAELREVCREQLQGDWQIPAELVRFALRRGGAEVELERRRRGFLLRCRGVECRDGELGHAAVALDVRQPAPERHQAIVALERIGGNALLWAGGAAGARLTVGHRIGGEATVLEVRAGRRAALEENAVDELPGGFEVRFRAAGFDERRALGWLRTACRFAPVAITVDGRPVVQGFGATLRSVSLGRPVPGGVALTPSGDAPRLWLLRHGVLATRATVPGYPPFEAVLELGEVTAEGVGPDDLRRAAQPLLPVLLDRVGDLIVEAVVAAPSEHPEALDRICTLGLRAIRAGLARERLLDEPLIPVLAAGGGAPTRLSVTELRHRCEAHQGSVRRVPPQPSRRRSGPAAALLLPLTPEQHQLLADLLPARLEQPEPQPRSARWRRLASGLAAAAARARAGAATTLGAGALADAELLDEERSLLRQLTRAVVDGSGERLEVRMAAGVGRPRRNRQTVLLPRNNPLVVRAVRLVAGDESWLYPVALAVLADLAAPAPELRSAWQASGGNGRRETGDDTAR
jgi:plasmid stability protein